MGVSEVQGRIDEGRLCDWRGESQRTNRILRELDDMVKYLREPEDIIKVWAFRNTIMINNSLLAEAYDSCHQLAFFCRARGFVKAHLLDQQLNLVRIQLLTGNSF
jgi:hypothetical protein